MQQQQQIISTAISAKTSVVLFSIGCLLIVGASMSVNKVNALNLVDQSADQSNGKVTLALIENPELVARVLDNLLRSVIYSSSVDMQLTTNGAQKRGLDLGISRGYSGSQAGKHLMGLSAASFANGPGRR